MHKNRRVCYCRACQNARLDSAAPRRGAVALAKTALFSFEGMLALLGFVGLVAWAWMISRHL